MWMLMCALVAHPCEQRVHHLQQEALLGAELRDQRLLDLTALRLVPAWMVLTAEMAAG
jgi:hypothetical protein